MASPDPSDDRKSRTAEDAKVFDAFADIVRSKFTSQENVDRLDRLYSDPAYESEKRIVRTMNNNGLMKGLAFALFTFASLRKGPDMIARHLARKAAQRRSGAHGDGGGGWGGYQFDAVRGGSPFASQQGGSPRASFVLRALKLGLDAFVSLTLGAYATVAFTDKDKLFSDASSIPLVEGRSLISEEFCEDFVAEYKQIPSDFWKRDRNTVRPLRAIEDFVVNCQRRASYESTLRAQMGMRKSDAVSIPSPGVPKNLEVTLDDDGDGAVGAGDFMEDYFGAAASEGNGNEEGDAETLTEWSSIDDFEKGSDGKDSGWSGR